jgi:hypothetical protein
VKKGIGEMRTGLASILQPALHMQEKKGDGDGKAHQNQ